VPLDRQKQRRQRGYTRAVTNSRHANRRLQPLRYLHDCSDCLPQERLPGGACTHWKAPPLHGARQFLTFPQVQFPVSRSLWFDVSRLTDFAQLRETSTELRNLNMLREDCFATVRSTPLHLFFTVDTLALWCLRESDGGSDGQVSPSVTLTKSVVDNGEVRAERHYIWDFRAGRLRAAGGGERHEDLQEQLKPPNGGVFLGWNGIVIKNHGGPTLRVSQTPSISVKKMALQELHSKIKQTIASAVRRRGHKRRTLWRGVTTKLGQP